MAAIEKDRSQSATGGIHLGSGLFTMPAEAIADKLASHEISPDGPSSGLRLLTFYINYAGKRLSASRRRNLEKAKRLLEDRIMRALIERERNHQKKVA